MSRITGELKAGGRNKKGAVFSLQVRKHRLMGDVPKDITTISWTVFLRWFDPEGESELRWFLIGWFTDVGWSRWFIVEYLHCLNFIFMVNSITAPNVMMQNSIPISMVVASHVFFFLLATGGSDAAFITMILRWIDSSWLEHSNSGLGFRFGAVEVEIPRPLKIDDFKHNLKLYRKEAIDKISISGAVDTLIR